MFLVVDANILIGELLRKRGQDLIQDSRLILYISERVFSEANGEYSLWGSNPMAVDYSLDFLCDYYGHSLRELALELAQSCRSSSPTTNLD